MAQSATRSWRGLLKGAVILACATPAAASSESPERCNHVIEASIEGVDPAFEGSVLVVWKGRILHDVTYGAAFETGAMFDVASIAKQFTAAAILALQMDGRLLVSDPAIVHLAHLGVDLRPELFDISIHHLLTHTSGLPIAMSFEGVDTTDKSSTVQAILDQDLQTAPGESFAYNNLGYFLLAAIVEEASGEPFECYVKRRVFDRASMDDTGFRLDGELDPDKQSVRRYKRQGMLISSPVIAHRWNWANRGATGVITTIEDLHKWHRALRLGVVLDEVSTSMLVDAGGASYAYGWYVEEAGSIHGTERHFHSGATQGYMSHISRFPEVNGLIVILGDGDAPVRAIDEAIRQVLESVP